MCYIMEEKHKIVLAVRCIQWIAISSSDIVSIALFVCLFVTGVRNKFAVFTTSSSNYKDVFL